MLARRYEKDIIINLGRPEAVASYGERWEAARKKLKETLAGFKPHQSPTLRTSIIGKIKELQEELAAPPPPPRERRPAYPGSEFGAPRGPRRPRPTEG